MRMWSTCRRWTSTRAGPEKAFIVVRMSRQSPPIRLLSTRRQPCPPWVTGWYLCDPLAAGSVHLHQGLKRLSKMTAEKAWSTRVDRAAGESDEEVAAVAVLDGYPGVVSTDMAHGRVSA